MLTARQITKLVAMRRQMDALWAVDWADMDRATYRRLLFARWLVQTGRLSEDCCHATPTC